MRPAKSAVPELEIECYWLKDIYAAGKITEDIIEGIHESPICIADVTAHNPSVMIIYPCRQQKILERFKGDFTVAWKSC